jgi:hypothetical protein
MLVLLIFVFLYFFIKVQKFKSKIDELLWSHFFPKLRQKITHTGGLQFSLYLGSKYLIRASVCKIIPFLQQNK